MPGAGTRIYSVSAKYYWYARLLVASYQICGSSFPTAIITITILVLCIDRCNQSAELTTDMPTCWCGSSGIGSSGGSTSSALESRCSAQTYHTYFSHTSTNIKQPPSNQPHKNNTWYVQRGVSVFHLQLPRRTELSPIYETILYKQYN